MSYESVAEHMANTKPPARTNSLIARATAFFSSETFLNPSAAASFSLRI